MTSVRFVVVYYSSNLNSAQYLHRCHCIEQLLSGWRFPFLERNEKWRWEAGHWVGLRRPEWMESVRREENKMGAKCWKFRMRSENESWRNRNDEATNNSNRSWDERERESSIWRVVVPSGHEHRSSFGTPASADSICWPQPAHVNLPHVAHFVFLHILVFGWGWKIEFWWVAIARIHSTAFLKISWNWIIRDKIQMKKGQFNCNSDKLSSKHNEMMYTIFQIDGTSTFASSCALVLRWNGQCAWLISYGASTLLRWLETTRQPTCSYCEHLQRIFPFETFILS
jgi:hypothetical protein